MKNPTCSGFFPSITILPYRRAEEQRACSESGMARLLGQKVGTAPILTEDRRIRNSFRGERKTFVISGVRVAICRRILLRGSEL